MLCFNWNKALPPDQEAEFIASLPSDKQKQKEPKPSASETPVDIGGFEEVEEESQFFQQQLLSAGIIAPFTLSLTFVSW